MKNVKFKKWSCNVELKCYVDGNPAIVLTNYEIGGGSIIAKATVNIPGLDKKEVAIKDYSENEGMYKALLDADIITPSHRFISSGFIGNIPVCYLKSELCQ